MSNSSLPKNNDAENININLALKKELFVIWIVGWLVLMFCYLITGLSWEWDLVNQWFLQCAFFWWLVYYQTSKRLELNRPAQDSVLYNNLGWANRLTILRGGLIAMTGGFIFLQYPPGLLAWFPAVLYSIAAIIDRVDGYVARKTKHQSLLGTELDTVFDALGLALAPLLAVWYGKIHWTYLVVSCAYYLFQFGVYYRHRHGLPVYTLPPTFSRRAIAGIQMGFIAVVLWPLYEPPATTIAGFAFMIPVIAGFIIDWLIVSGKIVRDSKASIEFFSNLYLIGEMIFLPFLRILVGTLLFIIMTRPDHSFITAQSFSNLSSMLVSVMTISASMIVLGILGRFSAIFLVTLLGLYYSYSPVETLEIVLLVSVIWIISFGTGRFNLWRWDEHWVNRYDGE
jgi:CDP-diacylglycerol--glycerol-3-phosphate 3-phosphatidyltransferase